MTHESDPKPNQNRRLPMTREEFETALDTDILWIRVPWSSGPDRWYRCRRNGRTKLWKRLTSRFEIPVAYRYRDSTRVSDRDWPQVHHWFKISEEKPQ